MREANLREHAESIIIKDVRSQERLLDEVSLFLHRVVNRMPEKKRQIIRDLHETDALFKDKKILVVDDDMRTTFAVSRLLSERGMTPLKAENGERALRVLEQEPDVGLVLMGYHDAADGRIRNHETDPITGTISESADHRTHSQGHAGGSGEMHRSRSERLPDQTPG